MNTLYCVRVDPDTKLVNVQCIGMVVGLRIYSIFMNSTSMTYILGERQCSPSENFETSFSETSCEVMLWR